MLHDRAEDRRLQMLPVRAVLGDGDEIVAEEDAGDAGNLEQPAGERRSRGRAFGVTEIGRAFLQHHLAGQKLERRRVRRRLGLDEHVRNSGLVLWNSSK
jgi:hypothetical protein